MRFKVGDRVKCVYNDNGSDEFVGAEGYIIDVDGDRSHPYGVSFAGGIHFSGEELMSVSMPPVKAQSMDGTCVVITEPLVKEISNKASRRVLWNNIRKKHKNA